LAYFDRGLDADPALAASIRGELARQRDGIELIASENSTARASIASACSAPP
jgi:glycine hydroxymethyltransferase